MSIICCYFITFIILFVIIVFGFYFDIYRVHIVLGFSFYLLFFPVTSDTAYTSCTFAEISTPLKQRSINFIHVFPPFSWLLRNRVLRSHLWHHPCWKWTAITTTRRAFSGFAEIRRLLRSAALVMRRIISRGLARASVYIFLEIRNHHNSVGRIFALA